MQRVEGAVNILAGLAVLFEYTSCCVVSPRPFAAGMICEHSYRVRIRARRPTLVDRGDNAATMLSHGCATRPAREHPLRIALLPVRSSLRNLRPPVAFIDALALRALGHTNPPREDSYLVSI